MSEVLAQLQKKGISGEYTLAQKGEYTDNANITCKVGDILIFMGNTNGTPTPTNMTYICHQRVLVRTIPDNVASQVWVYIATDTTVSLNMPLYEGNKVYIVLTR